MWIPSSTPSPDRSQPNRVVQILAVGLIGVSLLAASPAPAQMVVYDPRNHLENALQAARQLESLANEARSLAASPYSHAMGSSRTLEEMAELAKTARGLGTTAGQIERQFETLYPEDLSGTDVLRLLEQSQARNANARSTSEDVARTAAALERQGETRAARLSGALAASETATGQTAATQSGNQLLAVLAEDMAAMRTILLAQARLDAERGAREAADRASGEEARRQRWRSDAVRPTAPRFDPLAQAGH